jgi:hypothetical protein
MSFVDARFEVLMVLLLEVQVHLGRYSVWTGKQLRFEGAGLHRNSKCLPLSMARFSRRLEFSACAYIFMGL